MRLEEKYRELLRLKKEIDRRLNVGTGFQEIRKLMLYLVQDRAYQEIKAMENQLIMLESFFSIWLREKKKLPDLRIDTDIFEKVSCLADVEQKYQRIKFCGLRIENNLPDTYRRQGLEWLIEDKVSGIAIGKIIISETKNREENLLCIARFLRQTGDLVNTLLLLQYANEAFSGQEELLLMEADIWIEGRQLGEALKLLMKIEKPSQSTEELMNELQRVTKND